MKSIKKISRLLLLLLISIFSFSIKANAAIPNTTPPIIKSSEKYASTHAYAESGTFRINSGSLEVRNDLNYGTRAVDKYYTGETFNYYYVCEVYDSNHWFKNRYASYVSNSGVRRYVYFMTIQYKDAKGTDVKSTTRMANYQVW